MLRIKEFSEKKVVFIDENNNEHTIKCDNENQSFDLDIIEDILEYQYKGDKNGKK